MVRSLAEQSELSSTTSEPIYINGATLHKRSQTFSLSKGSVISFRTMSEGGGHCGLIYVTHRNLNSSAQPNRFNKSRIQAKTSLFFIAFCKVHRGSFGFIDDPEGFVKYPLSNSTVDCHNGRIAFHFSWSKTLQIRERNENTEHLPATFALKRRLTRYISGAARDPEMLHKIYINAEPVAVIYVLEQK